MGSPVPPSDLRPYESFVDWQDLSGLDRIVAVYGVGDNAVVVETAERREVRITAWLDHRTGQYVADFERRCAVTSGGHQLRVWAHTQAYARCVGPDVSGCLEAAILEVDRMPVY
jgi:hypothetical protein